jgi:putative YphP/YqiW family bacilliredoxin
MYPEELVRPMRAELSDIGFDELKTADAVENHLKEKKGTTLLVINSVCGCAAGTARPGVAMALHNAAKKPVNLATVFAGVDRKRLPKRGNLPCLFLLPPLLSHYLKMENWCIS